MGELIEDLIKLLKIERYEDRVIYCRFLLGLNGLKYAGFSDIGGGWMVNVDVRATADAGEDGMATEVKLTFQHHPYICPKVTWHFFHASLPSFPILFPLPILHLLQQHRRFPLSLVPPLDNGMT